MSDNTSATQAVLDRHLKAFADRDVDAIMKNYAEDAVILSARGAVRGHESIVKFFAGFIKHTPPEVQATFDLTHQECEQDIAYIVWSMGDNVPLGTDTYKIRDDKITLQTVAVHQI